MIYLDNAATSFPKPEPVIEATARCLRESCGNAGRGSHALALAAAEQIYECRELAAEFFGAESPENVIFTWNTTAAVNTVVKGLLRPGDHILISDMEHNAVFRPVFRMAREGKITYDVFPTDPCGADPDFDLCAEIERRIRPGTRLLIAAHASNVCSSVLPLERIGALCRRHGILFAVDAAQSAGHLPIHLQKMNIDALCVPGHKGLLGPQGTGLLILREGLICDTLTEGGSGFHSLEGEMPTESPERYEAGTLPTPSIAGLAEGIRFVMRQTPEQIFCHEAELNRRLQTRLLRIPGVRVYCPEKIGSVLLFTVGDLSADCAGQELNRMGFCVRSGYHCCALGHATLHTPPGGAIRVSPGYRTTVKDVDAFADAVREIQSRN